MAEDLTLRQVAAATGVTKKTVDNWRRKGRGQRDSEPLPARRCQETGRWLVSQAQLRRWLGLSVGEG